MVKTNIPQNLTIPGLNMATKRPLTQEGKVKGVDAASSPWSQG